MKRNFALLLCTLMVIGLLASCGQSSSPSSESPVQPAPSAGQVGSNAESIIPPEKDIEMQYISVADATQVLDNPDYTFLDVRKASDYDTSHIPGAVGADMDAAKNGDFDAGVSTMQTATMQTATKDLSNNLIIICYSGKSYAQATTNVLSALGYDMSKVYTLEGGFTAWSETYPDLIAAE